MEVQKLGIVSLRLEDEEHPVVNPAIKVYRQQSIAKLFSTKNWPIVLFSNSSAKIRHKF